MLPFHHQLRSPDCIFHTSSVYFLKCWKKPSSDKECGCLLIVLCTVSLCYLALTKLFGMMWILRCHRFEASCVLFPVLKAVEQTGQYIVFEDGDCIHRKKNRSCRLMSVKPSAEARVYPFVFKY